MKNALHQSVVPLVFVLSLFLVGCGNTFDLNSGNAAMVGAAAHGMATESAGAISDVDDVMGSPTALRRIKNATCPNITPASPVDGDSDTIPLTATMDFSVCTGGLLFNSISGTGTITDKDDGDDDSGFTTNLTNLTLSGDSLSMATTMNFDATTTVNGSDQITQIASTMGYSLSMTVGDNTIGMSANATVTHTPSSPLDNINESSHSGTVAFSGDYSFSYNGNDGTFSLSTTNLTYTTDGCSGVEGINGGTLTITNGTDSVVVTYNSGCSYAVTFNGEAVSSQIPEIL